MGIESKTGELHRRRSQGCAPIITTAQTNKQVQNGVCLHTLHAHVVHTHTHTHTHTEHRVLFFFTCFKFTFDLVKVASLNLEGIHRISCLLWEMCHPLISAFRAKQFWFTGPRKFTFLPPATTLYRHDIPFVHPLSCKPKLLVVGADINQRNAIFRMSSIQRPEWHHMIRGQPSSVQ